KLKAGKQYKVSLDASAGYPPSTDELGIMLLTQAQLEAGNLDASEAYALDSYGHLDWTFTAPAEDVMLIIANTVYKEDSISEYYYYLDKFVGNEGWIETVECYPDINAAYIAEAGKYRFGFNGMERDDEVKGSGNS